MGRKHYKTFLWMTKSTFKVAMGIRHIYNISQWKNACRFEMLPLEMIENTEFFPTTLQYIQAEPIQTTMQRSSGRHDAPYAKRCCSAISTVTLDELLLAIFIFMNKIWVFLALYKVGVLWTISACKVLQVLIVLLQGKSHLLCNYSWTQRQR